MTNARGFTLLEVLVAMTILAIVGITVYTQSGTALEQAVEIERRVIANWVAENALEELRIALRTADEPPRAGSETRYELNGSREWRVLREIRNTDNENIREVRVTVNLEGDTREYAYAQLVGYVGRGG